MKTAKYKLHLSNYCFTNNYFSLKRFFGYFLLIFANVTWVHASSLDWMALNSGLTNQNVTDIVTDSKGNFFIGTSGGGLFKSSDTNLAWTTANTGLSNLYINTLAISDNDTVFAGTNGGMFSTVDSGATWKIVNSVPSDTAIYAITTDENGSIFTSYYNTDGTSEIVKSDDDGANWTVVYSGLKDGLNALTIDEEGNLYAGGTGIFKGSSDGKAVWGAINNGLVTDPYAYAGTPPSMIVLSIATDSSGNIYAGTEGGLFKSTDKGSNWVNIENTPTGRIHTIIFDSNQNIYIGSGSGSLFGSSDPGTVFRSTDDGANWAQVRGNLPSTVYGLVTDTAGNITVATTGGGVLATNMKAFTISGVTSGSSSTSINLKANISVAFDDLGKSGFLYVHASHPNFGQYLLGPDGWVSLNQSETVLENLVAHSSVTLGTHDIQIMTITPFDLVVLKGAVITVGYGTSSSDVINGQKFKAAYTFE